jgi:beta-lactamase superfamily II metal-dependent hydrolase
MSRNPVWMPLGARLLAMALSIAMATAFQPAAARALCIYFIDVEGGQATLVVTPDGQSLLIDAGWAGDGVGFHPGDPAKARDANRILAAARDAGISRIDYLLVTHFHSDHMGGALELSQLLPVRAFVDHGAPHPHAAETSADTRNGFAVYVTLRDKVGHHIEPKPGDHLPLKHVEVTVVSSGGATLTAPLLDAGAPNPACRDQAMPAGDADENPRSTGVLVRYGQFRFLDVGDLSGQPLFDLVCPVNLVGHADAYLVAHHGGADASDPATFTAIQPRVVMINNALKKGGQRPVFESLHRAPGLEDVWQLHWSADAAELNFPAASIANVDDSSAHWIKLVAKRDGSFRVLNGRTGVWKHYAARQAFSGRGLR